MSLTEQQIERYSRNILLPQGGGGMGAESRVGDRMEEWAPATELIHIAEAVRRLFDRLGDRRNRRKARLRFAVERLGADAFRALLRETVQAVTDEGTPACLAALEVAAAPADPKGDFRTLLKQAAGQDVLSIRAIGGGHWRVAIRKNA